MPTVSEPSGLSSRARRNPSRRKDDQPAQYADSNEGGSDDESEEEGFEGEANPASSSSDDEEIVDEEEEAQPRLSKRAKKTNGKAKDSGNANGGSRRQSSRANKFTASMAEPSATSIRDLVAENPQQAMARSRRETRDASAESSDDHVDAASGDESEPDAPTKPRPKKNKAKSTVTDSLANSSPFKSPARRHAKIRRTIRSEAKGAYDSSDESSLETIQEEDDEEEEPLKVQRILAVKNLPRGQWKTICSRMQTSEIECGSRWFQTEEEKQQPVDDNEFEERFLIKWKDLSFLHCSWEAQDDLENQIEGVKTNLATFFRKSENGLLFSADERCDGDYFDPAYTQVDRILEVHLPEDGEYPPLSYDKEDSYTAADFGIVMDKCDPKYEDGTGRQFLIKWANLPYSESSYEFERDLILNEVDYKEELKNFLYRNSKPSKTEAKEKRAEGDKAKRALYKIFGDRANTSEAAVEEYKQELQAHVYKNGGLVRDYQAEGIAWMLANYVNDRCSILADEMGLGKTLQTAAFVNILEATLHRSGPVLIIAPLSTLTHWKREFNNWTDLNVVVYHGSAEDRKLIRELEFAYESDRPEGGVAFNQTYLKKCLPKKSKSRIPGDSPWMVQVIITTPEMVVCDDSSELVAVNWEALVVDEAHRLKNSNSKLTVQLKDNKFSFMHKILLTGTPIQNDVQEFWTLLNFIDPDSFEKLDDFMDKYGDLKTKERIDELHEEIRPYILRRLKEDVEKSVPPKEETLIEVELTVAQKQYYRALYEKNVAFLHKNKRALDGPSLNNLAMQLRKCCNHLFLLNGVEDEYREELAKSGEDVSEGDLLVKCSGKLVLLDKLLPRLRDEGHRVLIFSQFKIMLDILEDYFKEREMKFERIDGSITGNKRQQAIDRFQAPDVDGKDSPFIMMLSTRAGGVGINLTAADTCVIFDSDFNPQNDLQAQARCHRIGQTKNVKVYRLLTRKTYEMQMFHMSSLKMGLDQAVLKGFESGAAGEGALSKDQVEKLLRHGAYDILNEEKAGTGEAESNNFVQQDIDSILERCSRTVVHDNTGSQSNAGGGTFSKASFKVSKSPDAGGTKESEDVDIEDPDFWKKMLGDPVTAAATESTKKRRRRTETNYAESAFTRNLDATIFENGSSSSETDEDDEDADTEGDGGERTRWGGSSSESQWSKEDAETLLKSILTYGYGNLPWDEGMKKLEFGDAYNADEVKRMKFSIVLLALLEAVEDDVAMSSRRRKILIAQATENDETKDGGVLAREPAKDADDHDELAKKAFFKLWSNSGQWTKRALNDAVDYARRHEPRENQAIDKVLRPDKWKNEQKHTGDLATNFAKAWQSLKNRGWKAQVITSGEGAGKTRYEYDGEQFWSYEAVLKAARENHPDLADMCNSVLELEVSNRRETMESRNKEREDDLSLTADNVDEVRLRRFLERYGPLQLLADRKRTTKIRISRKVPATCTLMENAEALVERANAKSGDAAALQRLASILVVDKRTSVPHPLWTPRHDAVLIHAITKHGWIDQDSRFRAIAEDATISWGAPFDGTAGKLNSAALAQSAQDAGELRACAQRAATFFNQNRELLDEYKGFNQRTVAQAYGLEREAVEDVEESLEYASSAAPGAHPTWVVDEGALEALSTAGSTTNGSGPREPVDLPTSKDLKHRARTILTRVTADNASSSQPLGSPSHGYAVLDQSNRCNTLLAAMLNGLLKAPSQLKDNKKMGAAAAYEANMRLQAAKSHTGKDAEKSVAEWEQLVSQVNLVRTNLAKAARQTKNVVRVMLGEEPHVGRNPSEPLFPVLKSASTKHGPSALKTHSKSSAKTQPNAKASGEFALETATRRLYARSERENGQLSNEDLLELTEIETIILSVACAFGLPVWKNEDPAALFATSSDSPRSKSSPYGMSWAGYGAKVAVAADELFQKEKEKLTKMENDFSSLTDSNQSTARNYPQELENAERAYGLKERAAGQAADYAQEPETLAKKTIMMLAKVQRHMGKATTGLTSVCLATELALGPKVIAWLENEIMNWASSLDLLDTAGRPLGFTAVDFIDDLPESERAAIEIAAIMDKKGSRAVMSQMALMTRLRSLFLGKEPKAARLEKALISLVASGDKWEWEPTWWATANSQSKEKSTIRNDQLLLERLLHRGFAGVLEDTKSYGLGDVAAARTSFKNLGLTKAAVQVRAGQLARELHAVESLGETFRWLDEKRSKSNGPSQARGTVQTGLSSFFGQAKGNDAEVIDVDSPSPAKKRKADSKAKISSEKKPRPSSDYSDVEVIS